MCSIMGCCSDRDALYLNLRRAFDRTISRGPDDSRIIDTGNGLLGLSPPCHHGSHPEGYAAL